MVLAIGGIVNAMLLPLFLKMMYITIANRQTQNNKEGDFHKKCYCQSIDHGYSINHDRL